MISTRAIKKVDINIVNQYVNWELAASPICYDPRNTGRPPKLSNVQILKLVYIQEKEQITYDTDMEKALKTNNTYRSFVGLRDGETLSHDTISRIKRKISTETWAEVHLLLDKELEALNYFKDDNLSFDGTDVRTHINSSIGDWGAKSDDKKFHGLWLMTLNSTNTDIVRRFEIKDASTSQVDLAKDVLFKAKDIDMSNIGEISGDGIFDTKEIRRIIDEDLGKPAVIPYNCRNSKIKEAENLPDGDWRLESTKYLKDKIKFQEHYKIRTASERENSRLKEWTIAGRIEEKTTRCPKIKRRTVINQIVISMLSTQITALGQWINILEHPIAIQKTLTDYMELALC